MIIVAIVIVLGLLTNALVVTYFLQTSYPRFSSKCSRCGYQLPLMEYPTVIDTCPGCVRLEQQNSNGSATKGLF